MVQPRWHKVYADLWANKMRSLLVVLSIAVGVFAIGIVSGMANIFIPDMASAWLDTNPRLAIIYTWPFGPDLLKAIQSVPGVAKAEGRTFMMVYVEVSPGNWRQIRLVATPPLDQMTVSRITADNAPNQPAFRELSLERDGLKMLPVKIGDYVKIRQPDDTIRTMRVGGIVHDLDAPEVMFTSMTQASVSPDTMAWLGGSRDPNSIYLTVTERPFDEQHVKDVAHEVAQKIEKSGRPVGTISVYRPGEHPAYTIVQTLLAVLTFMGVLVVLLSGFLVVNTINALLNQHIRQIGVMKAIGARTGQIILMYFVLVAILGLVAAAITILPSAYLGYQVSVMMANMLNFDLRGFRIPFATWSVQLAIGILVPLATSIYPVLHGTHITVREAISSYGLGQGQFGKGLLDRLFTLLGRVGLFSRPILISLRNTIRRKARLLLTLSTLTLGGAIFIAVLNLSAAFDVAIRDAFGYFMFDENVTMNRLYRIDKVAPLLASVPGVTDVEAWGGANGQVLAADKETGIDIVLFAPPAGSQLIKPVITSGRWLMPGDENGIVIGNHMLAKRPDLKPGDTLVIKVNSTEYEWRIVGVYRLAGNSTLPVLYVNREYLDRILGTVGRSADYRLSISPNDPASQARVAKALETVMKDGGFMLNRVTTGAEQAGLQTSVTNILVYFLLGMSILIAVVGGIGLMGTMSMNTLERTREIGVMRSVGASNWAVLRLILVEGMFVGVISWLLGVALAFPLAQGMDVAVGIAFMTMPLPFVFSMEGVVLWLVVVLVLSSLASVLPAWNATRLTVRDVLAYE